MKTLKIVVVTVVTVLILLGTGLFLLGYFKPKPAGIFVDSSPASSVYIDGAFAGKTPLQKTIEAGTVDLRMVPEIGDQNLIPFETKVTLVSGIQTVVRREFGKTEIESSGDIISFEREPGSDTGLVVISTPDNAQISVDGVARGFAPYKTSTISPAKHQITVKAVGYVDRIMTVNTQAGYRLTLFAKLAKTSESPTPVPSPTPQSQYFVVILTTPTGYLRVRTEPGTAGEEIGQVKPGDKFPYLGTDSATGWFKIQFEEPTAGLPNGIAGWVSNQYAKQTDASGSAVINPTPNP